MSTTAITREDIRRFNEYCQYEDITFITRSELVETMTLLGIGASVRAMLRSGTVSTVMRNTVYQVPGRTGTIQQLLAKIFSVEEPYYLYGIYAYNTYGFIDQLPSMYQVANKRIKRTRQLGGFTIQFKIPADGYFYGIDSDTMIIEKERAIIDFCYTYGYERYLSLLRKVLQAIDLNKLITYTLSYPLNNVARRVIYGLNSIEKVAPEIIDSVVTSSLITLTDSPSKRGPIDKTFNLIINT